jgi:hypothetical protein
MGKFDRMGKEDFGSIVEKYLSQLLQKNWRFKIRVPNNCTPYGFSILVGFHQGSIAPPITPPALEVGIDSMVSRHIFK